MQLLLTIELENDPAKALMQVRDSFEGIVMGIKLLKEHEEQDVVAGNIFSDGTHRQIGRMTLTRRDNSVNVTTN